MTSCTLFLRLHPHRHPHRSWHSFASPWPLSTGSAHWLNLPRALSFLCTQPRDSGCNQDHSCRYSHIFDIALPRVQRESALGSSWQVLGTCRST